MIVDAGHLRWIVGTCLAGVACFAVYAVLDRSTPGGVTGGTTPGLWFGVIGTALMLFCGLLAAHRKFPAWWWIGSRKAWLKAHIWLGFLSVVVILCHSGFRLGGLLAVLLWVVLGAIVLSGIVGLMLQQSLPGFLARQVPGEVSYEQIPHYCGVLRGRADDICDALKHVAPPSDDATQRFYEAYDHEIRGFFRSPAPRSRVFSDEPSISVWFERIGEALRLGPPGESEATIGLIEDLRPTLDPAKLKELAPRLDKLKSNVERLFDTVDTDGLPAAAQAAFAELKVLAGGAPEVVSAVASQLASTWMFAIESMVIERDRLRTQERIHRWLHGWLLLHVPLSAALAVLAIAHIVMSLYY